jgi:hypothetical protein
VDSHVGNSVAIRPISGPTPCCPTTPARFFIFLIALVVAVALAGCTGVPERSEEATKLQPELGTLLASTVRVPYDPYENALGRGASLLVDVSMPDATDPKGTCAG